MTNGPVAAENRKGESVPAVRIVWGCLFLFAAALWVLGVRAGLSLGDESQYYRFAKNAFWLGGRPVFDVLYESGAPPGFYFILDSLWPMGLSWFWKISGGISLAGAQFYHCLFYLLLIAATYFSARRLYDVPVALGSALILASIPMIASFGMLFYVDVPGAALMMCGFFLLIRRRYFLAGILIGLQFLMKRNMLFFLPAVWGVLLYENRGSWKAMLRGSFYLLVPVFFIIAADTVWRHFHFPQEYSLLTQFQTRIQETLRPLSGIKPKPQVLAVAPYSNSSIFSLKDNAAYFGFLLPAGLLLYLLAGKKEKHDLYLWGFTGVYVLVDVAVKALPDIRYFLSVTPFLAVLAAKGIMSKFASKRWVLTGFLICAILQFGASAGYTAHRRIMPTGILEGMDYVRQNIPKDALVVYPELNFLEYADRRMVWAFFDLNHFLWGNREDKKRVALEFGLEYVAVKKKRIYDDALEGHHYGGYPVSFVNWLETSGSAERLFENHEMSVWKLSWEEAKA